MTRIGNVYMGPISELPNPSTDRIRPGSFFVNENLGTTYVLKSVGGVSSWYAVGTAAEYTF